MYSTRKVNMDLYTAYSQQLASKALRYDTCYIYNFIHHQMIEKNKRKEKTINI